MALVSTIFPIIAFHSEPILMKKILFVCLGNICRSPSAEAVFNSLIEKKGLKDKFQCDSAGTAAYHAGDPADYRMKQFAKKRDYNLTSISRPVNPKKDFDRFDLIIGMDRLNTRDLKAMARNDTDRRKIHLMTDFSKNKDYDSVPDPYYGGASGFELVLDILEDACSGLLEKLQQE
jgi:protein-tyrosine phosphatase